MIREDVIRTAVPVLFEGFKMTVIISLLALVIGFAVGILLTLGAVSKRKGINAAVAVYIKVFRNTPFMIQLYLIYYALPKVGIRFSTFWTGIAALALYSAAYFTIILKMGIDSVPKGQWEAAEALQLKYLYTLRKIIFPQMIGVIVPPIVNQIETSVKESSVLSIITVSELTMAANEVIGQTYAPFSVYVVACVFYWMLNLVFELAGKRYETKRKMVKTELSI